MPVCACLRIGGWISFLALAALAPAADGLAFEAGSELLSRQRVPWSVLLREESGATSRLFDEPDTTAEGGAIAGEVVWLPEYRIDLTMGWHGGPPTGPHYNEFSRALRPAEDYAANRRLPPKQLALVLKNEYGSGSLLVRSVSLLAPLAAGLERGTQAPLDRVNAMSDQLVTQMRYGLGLKDLPYLRLRSELSLEGFAVRLRASW